MPRHQTATGLFGIKTKGATKSFPLSKAPDQQVLKVVQIRGAMDLCSRMAAMGIQLGSEMKVRRIGPAGCLAQIGRNRHIVSLGGKVAEKIWVTRK